MSTKIDFTHNGSNYTLEFNRETASRIEQQGFDINRFDSASNTMIPLLYRGAFYKNHRRLDPKKADEIYRDLPRKEELLTALLKMYGETVNTLMEEPEDDEGNVKWEVRK